MAASGPGLRGAVSVTGAGRTKAWFGPGSGSGGVRGGCRICGDVGGRLDGEALREHLDALDAGGSPACVGTHGGGVPPPETALRGPHGAGRSEAGAARRLAVWAASASADDSPGAAYLTGRGAWPAGERLPASVRWLPALAAGALRPRLPGGSAGALCYLFAAPGEADPAAIQLEAVTAGGERLPFGAAGKRPSVTGSDFGGGRRVFVARMPGRVEARDGRERPRDHCSASMRPGAETPGTSLWPAAPESSWQSCDEATRPGGVNDTTTAAGVHLCEGPLDALALVHLARLGSVELAGAAVIGTAGAGGWTLAAVASWPGPVTLWVQADGPGRRAAARIGAALERAGREWRLELAPAGMDWADVAAVEAAEREAIRDA